jgi:hypothetical protein
MMDTATVEGASEKRRWGVIGLVTLTIIVAVAPLFGGTGGVVQKWVCYLAGLDFFCVASGVGDDENDAAERDEVRGG